MCKGGIIAVVKLPTEREPRIFSLPYYIGMNCARRNNPALWLLSTAQFSTGCIVIGGTVLCDGTAVGIVIGRTFSLAADWNIPHNFPFFGLLSPAQFTFCACGPGINSIVIQCTICIFSAPRRVVIGRTFSAARKNRRLLFAAHFKNSATESPYCYLQHISVLWVVIQCTVSNL